MTYNYFVICNLTKREGDVPNLNAIREQYPNEKLTNIFKKHITFSLGDDGSLPIDSYTLFDDGFENWGLVDVDSFDFNPTPKVFLKLNEEIEEDGDEWQILMTSEYRFLTPDMNEDEAYIYADHNGYCRIYIAENLADEVSSALEIIINTLNNGENKTLPNGYVLTKQSVKSDDGTIELILNMNLNGNICKYGWKFENENSLNEFEYIETFYSDTDGNEFLEQNYRLWYLYEELVINEEDNNEDD